MRTLWIGASIMLAAMACGCSSGEKPETGSSPSASKAPPLPPKGVELSVVEGVSIRRCSDSNGNYFLVLRSKELTAENAALFKALSSAAEFDGWIYDDAPLPEGVYNITVKASDDKKGLWELLCEAYEKAFNVRVRILKEMQEVHVLKRAEGKPLALKPSEGTTPSRVTENTPGGFGWRFRCEAMEDLAAILERYTDTRVVDETGLGETTYDFELSMDHWKPETAFPAVDALGLKLVKEKREVEVMRVQRADK